MQKSLRFIALALIYCVILLAGAQTVTAIPRPRTTAAPIERHLHVNPPGPNQSRYVYVPFDVPSHAIRISISYKYDRAKGANTIDIGLFDARSTGADTDPRGFRGWSGGRRSEFFVSRDEATPGYMPGAMQAGTWRIILGLYQVAPAGVDVTFIIDIETENGQRRLINTDSRKSSANNPVKPNAENSGPAPRLPEQTVTAHGGRWWTGDLHMHTVHSDGDWTIPGLIASARNSGLDFIVITDHNTASHHAELDRLARGLKQPLMIRGEEITTYGGHTNAWGLPSGKWIDFRTHPGDNARIHDIAAQAHRAGALISINHPFVLCGGCAWSYDPGARDFDAIEVWNGPWDFTDEPALKMWDKILQSGRHITAIASSDSHRLDTAIGKPATHVAANVLSQAALLKAIRAGRVYLSGEAAGPLVTFEGELQNGKPREQFNIGDEIHLNAPTTIRFLVSVKTVPPDAVISLISNGQVVRSFGVPIDSKPQTIEIECNQNSYFRLEIRDSTKKVLALTNPIYVKVGSR